MKITKLLAILFILTLTVQCGSDDEPTPDPVPENIYQNCCDVLPTEMDFNPGKIYVPNIFTPYGDGINDVFYLFSDDGIETIEVFKVMDADGNVVYEILDVLPNNLTYGWAPDENEPAGLFGYEITVKNTDGNEFDITGNICVLRCDVANPFDNFGNCGWPTQNSGMGEFDPTLPSLEEPCP